jgi:hypothetical protein
MPFGSSEGVLDPGSFELKNTSNQSDWGALSLMSKRKPLCGPMTTQPFENRATLATQTQPMMPAAGRQPAAAPKKPIGKGQLRENQALSTESARISRQNSLRKQRQAQKANALKK